MAENPNNSASTEPPRILVSALTRILKPLIKLLISKGITLPYLTRLVKSVYIDTAESHFELEGRRLTDSRISLLTGVHRKDVQKLRGVPMDSTEAPANISVGTRLVSTWVDDPFYTSDDDAPRALPIRSNASDQPSFESLVDKVSRKDLRPRVVLDELIRLGIVSVDEQQMVRLHVEGFVPDHSFDEKAWYFGENMAAHFNAGVHNLLDEGSPFMERSVSYSGLSDDDVQALEKKINRIGVDALKQINHDAQKLKQARLDSDGPGDRRFTFGVYFHQRKTTNDEQE